MFKQGTGIILAIVVAVMGLYWKLYIPSAVAYVWFDQYDMCQLEIPRLQFLARQLSLGEFPLWNPNIWAGQPVLGQAQPGMLYPLHLLLALFGATRGVLTAAALNWFFIFVHCMGAFWGYLFCRDQQLLRIPAILGGLLFSCGGMLGSVAWLDIGNGVALTPLVFLFLIRVQNGIDVRKNSTLLGVTLGAAWLTGHHEVPLVFSYLVLAVAVLTPPWRYLRNRRLDWRPTLGHISALLLAALVGAIQLMPLYEFGLQSKRWVGIDRPIEWFEKVPYEVHARYSLSWPAVAGILVPNTETTMGFTCFLGAACLIVGAIGIVASRGSRSFRLCCVIGIVAFLYATGPLTPIQRLAYEYIPLVDKARTPNRLMFLCCFFGSICFAHGLNFLLKERLSKKYLVFACIMGLSIATAITLMARFLHVSGVIPSLVSVTLVVISLILFRYGRPLAIFFCAAALIIDLRTVAERRITPLIPGVSLCATHLFQYSGLAKLLREEPSLDRITVAPDELLTDFGDLYGFEQLQGFVAAAPANLLRHELHTRRTQALFGVTHHIGIKPAFEDDVPVGEFNGMGLFRKPQPLPRAWVTHQVIPADDDGTLRVLIQDPSVNLLTSAIVLKSQVIPQLDACTDEEPVSVSQSHVNQVDIHADVRCRGLLVLNQTNYPGWKVDVDGRPSSIVEVFGAFRGVVLEAGSHKVTMRFRPASVYIGCLIAFIALIASACILLFTRQGKLEKADL